MGQALRRAAGRVRSSGPDTTSPSSKFQSINRRPTPLPGGPVEKVNIHRETANGTGTTNIDSHGVVEERDPAFDAMLSKISGRITTKPGGELETGETLFPGKYNRPLPKVRNTTPDSGRYEDRPAPPGTLNVSQLRQVMLLYIGRAEDHNGPLDVKQIADRFRLDSAKIQKILQFLSFPPENFSNTKNKSDQY